MFSSFANLKSTIMISDAGTGKYPSHAVTLQFRKVYNLHNVIYAHLASLSRCPGRRQSPVTVRTGTSDTNTSMLMAAAAAQ